jgi:hypothetical protein
MFAMAVMHGATLLILLLLPLACSNKLPLVACIAAQGIFVWRRRVLLNAPMAQARAPACCLPRTSIPY